MRRKSDNHIIFAPTDTCTSGCLLIKIDCFDISRVIDVYMPFRYVENNNTARRGNTSLAGCDTDPPRGYYYCRPLRPWRFLGPFLSERKYPQIKRKRCTGNASGQACPGTSIGFLHILVFWCIDIAIVSSDFIDGKFLFIMIINIIKMFQWIILLNLTIQNKLRYFIKLINFYYNKKHWYLILDYRELSKSIFVCRRFVSTVKTKQIFGKNKAKITCADSSYLLCIFNTSFERSNNASVLRGRKAFQRLRFICATRFPVMFIRGVNV